MRGRKPKPPHLKLVTGNPGRRPIVRAPKARKRRRVPWPPAHLNAEARAEWRRVAPRLVADGRFDPVLDREILLAYSNSVGTARQAQRALTELAAEKGTTASLLARRGSGGVTVSPLLTILRTASADAARFAEQLGLSPTSRARLGIAGEPAEPYQNDKYFQG